MGEGQYSVFISHSSEDVLIAEEISRQLETQEDLARQTGKENHHSLARLKLKDKNEKADRS